MQFIEMMSHIKQYRNVNKFSTIIRSERTAFVSTDNHGFVVETT